jgi:hypothetical protein
MKGWRIARYGHASKGKENSRINSEIRNSISIKRITVTIKSYLSFIAFSDSTFVLTPC